MKLTCSERRKMKDKLGLKSGLLILPRQKKKGLQIVPPHFIGIYNMFDHLERQLEDTLEMEFRIGLLEIINCRKP